MHTNLRINCEHCSLQKSDDVSNQSEIYSDSFVRTYDCCERCFNWFEYIEGSVRRHGYLTVYSNEACDCLCNEERTLTHTSFVNKQVIFIFCHWKKRDAQSHLPQVLSNRKMRTKHRTKCVRERSSCSSTTYIGWLTGILTTRSVSIDTSRFCDK